MNRFTTNYTRIYIFSKIKTFKRFMSAKIDPKKIWQQVMRLDCDTEQQTKIIGCGDFEFKLLKIGLGQSG